MKPEKLMIVPVTVGGAKVFRGLALIDSGATGSSVSDSFEVQARLNPTQFAVRLKHGKRILMERAPIVSGFVRVDSFPECTAQILFALVPEELIPEGCDMILGMDFLEQASARIDFRTLQMKCNGTVPAEFLGEHYILEPLPSERLI